MRFKRYITLLFTLVSLSLSAQNHRGFKVKIGEPLPNFELKLIDQTPINSDSLKGKVCVIQFTASWCGVCRKEMPHLEKYVWQRFKNKEFILLGVDLKETPKVVERFIKETQISYPIAIDYDGSVFELFTVPKAGVTRNIVVDREGKIIFLTRLFDENEFQQMIDVIAKELEKK